MPSVLQRTPCTAQGYIESDLAVADALPLHMVLVPDGTFTMGSAVDELGRYEREGPQKSVAVAQFLMGRYPVTQAQWRAVAALPAVNRELVLAPANFTGDNLPVEQVYWQAAVEFCDRLTRHTGRPYRLPTEAEWEYACRARTTTPFYFGDRLTSEIANYKPVSASRPYADDADASHHEMSYRETTVPVDYFGVANRFGLSDMHGNVWEWCQDVWTDYASDLIEDSSLEDSSPEDSSRESSAQKTKACDSEGDDSRIARGGSWYSSPKLCRSASRFHFSAIASHRDLGFRVACDYS